LVEQVDFVVAPTYIDRFSQRVADCSIERPPLGGIQLAEIVK
jgi:hypothetical protein